MPVHELIAAVEHASEAYRINRDLIASLTLTLIVADLDDPQDPDCAAYPQAAFLLCDTTDQDFSGALTFDAIQDADGITIELDDAGDRYYDDIALGNLDDAVRHVWAPFVVDEISKHQSQFTLDLNQIRTAVQEGRLP